MLTTLVLLNVAKRPISTIIGFLSVDSKERKEKKMSDLDEMELDYTRLHNGLCGTEELKQLEKKYKKYKVAVKIMEELKKREKRKIV